MNSTMDEISLLRQAQRHQLVVRGIGEEIDLEIGPGDDPSFSAAALVGVPGTDSVGPEEHEDQKNLLLSSSEVDQQDMEMSTMPQLKKKKKVVKKWREEWADTYKWAYVAEHDNTNRIFCSVCKEYGRKHRRNPYGNEGSRNMQMSALEEHNNSLLHKEAVRLQMASKEKAQPVVETPIYVKALLSKTAGSILEAVLKRDPHEVEFVQSVQEVVHSLEPVLAKNSQYMHILERMIEPERCVVFRVPWVDDRGEMHVNRGFRVQFSQVLGPCRGGLRFHPSMNLSISKFLAFEQTLKNALSMHKLGGAGGGSDFDPKGKSESEIMRFCQSFMDELYRYLGSDQDLPAEDVGVGPREMGYLFGQYKRLSGHFQGSFTGPKIFWSGSSLRTEATGYGLVFFARLILAEMNKELKGLRCAVSGSGKIAMQVLEKLLPCGAIPITISDSKGYLLDEEGFDYYVEDRKPWNERCDVAFPCASQNEIDQSDGLSLVTSGCRIVIEGANMPCTPQAVDVLRKAKVLIAPAKITGAGGVAVGELELNHEYNLMQWSVEDFENKIHDTMKQTYERSIKAACEYGILKDNPEALVHGANISAFLNLAQAMIDQGCV
ncbi:NADP-specific glutamate dehydrogenase-like isoform X2 [Carex littledalei]|uniref:glutamate dehydrogenase (NADP(+)) n=1 Tax=Carex littledalei TaxID=544730 RepID=A0A833QSI1_9POAL|nr:NADP-specific glutamate dehydrogenase-like isoform X2 [Carex littledalei]